MTSTNKDKLSENFNAWQDFDTAHKFTQESYTSEQDSFFTNNQNVASKQELEYLANLECTYPSSFSQIKSQYRKLMKKYHPDNFSSSSAAQAQAAKKIASKLNEAYEYFKEKNISS